MKNLTYSWLKIALTLCASATVSLHADELPHEKGKWGELVDWPLVAIHSTITPQGKVLAYGSAKRGNQFLYDVWDPDLGNGEHAHSLLPSTLGVNSFCSASIILPETGNILMAGGTEPGNLGVSDVPVFNTGDESISQVPNMSSARWYPTLTTLANGETLVTGGRDGTARPVVTPEIYSSETNTWRSLLGVSMVGYSYNYPRQWVAPDGRVFGYSANKNMYYINPTGNGQLQYRGKIPIVGGPSNSAAVMYQPGKILQVGGAGLTPQNTAYHNSAYVIDINGTDPVITEVEDPQQTGRILSNSVVLPDGKVMLVGGSGKWNVLADVPTRPELWDPTTESWSLMAPSSTARLYHSTVLLLKDGRVLVAGGGRPGPLTNTNAEIYSPPYLFNISGEAARPKILSAPGEAPYGSELTVKHSATDTISRVTLIKTGAVTHSYNMEQRFIELDFTAANTGSSVKVTLPNSPNIATPGFYYLHLLNAEGVPSQAHMIRISSTAVLPQEVGPYPVATVDDAAATAGLPVSLDVLANDTGSELFVSEVFQYTAKGGTTSLSNNKIIYTAKSDFNGEDSFWYTMEDNQGRTNSAKVTITVTGGTTNPIDVYPSAVPDSVTSNGGSSITIDPLANDTGNNLSLAAPDVWSLKGGSSLWDDNKIIYTPKPGFNGEDKIWYVLRDAQGRTNSGEITITVSGNNTAISNTYPTATPDIVSTTAGAAITIDALANDTGSELTLVAPDVWSFKGGNVSLVDNKISYIPAADFTGIDKIWYAFIDSQGRTNSGEITITVSGDIGNSINRSATATHVGSTHSTTSATTVDQAVTIDALAGRTETDLVLQRPSASTLEGGSVDLVNNKLVYTPKQGFVGNDEIWFVFRNAQGLTYNGEVLIDVNPSEDTTESTTISSTGTTTTATSNSDSGGGSFSWMMLLSLMSLLIGSLRKTHLRR